jgi:ABC-2 type transport system ATP-binding protein
LQGKVGLACADADVNPAWTAAGYLERVALLDVGSRGVAKRRAQQALESLGLGRLSSRTLGALTRVERLAVALARASLSAPELIVLESGFDGLGVADANWLRQVIAGLVTRARLMVSFADLSGNGRHVVLRHDHCVLMFCGRVVAQGDPKVVLRPVSFLVTVTRHAKRLRDELLTLGCSVQADATLDDATTTQLVVAGGGDDLSDRIVQVAVDHGVPVIELLPVGIETSGETGA